MPATHAEVSAVIPVSPQVVYDILRDYAEAHPAILPKPWFGALTVHQGGRGAGTVFSFSMNLLGKRMHYHMEVTEPSPMRLVESDHEKGIRTSFAVVSEGFGARVTIRTDWQSAESVAGWLERISTAPLLRQIYRQQLALLEKEALSRQLENQLVFRS